MFKQIPKIDEMVSLEIVNYRGHQRKKNEEIVAGKRLKFACVLFFAHIDVLINHSVMSDRLNSVN